MFAVAIDGPAGAGKSSVAKAAAKELGFVYVDTGALYRTIALYVLRQGVDPKEREQVEALLPQIQIGMEYTEQGQKMLLNGEDVTGLIRTPEVSMATLPARRFRRCGPFCCSFNGIWHSGITCLWTAGTSAP